MGGYSLRSSRSSYYSRAEEQRLSLPDSIDGCWCGSETRTDLRNFRSKIFSEQQQQQQEQRMRHLQRSARTSSPAPTQDSYRSLAIVLMRQSSSPLSSSEFIIILYKQNTSFLRKKSAQKCRCKTKVLKNVCIRATIAEPLHNSQFLSVYPMRYRF